MDTYQEIQEQIESNRNEAKKLMPSSEFEFEDMTGEVSDCCGAVIIFHDICSDCKEHI